MTAIDERALGAAIIEGSNMAGERLVTQIVTAYLEALGPGSTGEAEGWRDIKSAPKDRHVMLFGKQTGEASDVQFKGEFVTAGYWDAFDDAWFLAGSNWSGPFFMPTHWRPLPEPPSAMLAAAGGRDE